MKRTIEALLCATAWTGVFGVAPAQAEPISTFFIGVGYGLTAGATVGGAYLGTLGAGVAVGQFLAANIGTLLLAGATLLYQAMQNRQMESSQVNFRQPNAIRRHARGLEEVGGSIGFASFDDTGAFWYMVIHCDSELTEAPIAVKFDDVIIAKDGAGKVTTEDFQGDESGWFGWTNKKQYFSHWLATFSAANPVPAMPTAFTAAFPEWDASHKLAGCTVSIVKIDPVTDDKDVSSVYRWRGAIGLGEPSVSIIGIWGTVPDPRVPGFDPDDQSTWVRSKNPALIAAWHRVRRQGFDMPTDEINWDLVADNADKCDVAITDRYGEIAPLYSNVGGVWSEDRENKDVEMDILASCDGMSMFDSEGRWYPKVGFWEEPQLTLTRDRDILAMQDSEASDGESETDGVVVEYKEPTLGYVMQPCAPWKNPNFYVEGREPRYLRVKIPTIKNHRQAVTVAKAIGTRSQPTRRIGPQTGLRGRRAKRERIVAIDYDETITGTWQIPPNLPVELDAQGATAVLGLVPVGPNNWTLLPGEEGEKPVGETIDRNPVLPDLLAPVLVSAPASGLGGFTIAVTPPLAPNALSIQVAVRTSIGEPVSSDLIVLGSAPANTATPVNIVVGGGSRTNIVTNGTFTGSAAGWTLAAGWTYAANAVTHAGASSNLSQAQVFADDEAIRTQFTCSGRTAGSFNIRLSGGTTVVQGTGRASNGTFNQTLTEPNQATNNNLLLINGGTGFDGTIDDVIAYREAEFAGCLSAGTRYVYVRCIDGQNVGDWDGPYAVAVI